MIKQMSIIMGLDLIIQETEKLETLMIESFTYFKNSNMRVRKENINEISTRVSDYIKVSKNLFNTYYSNMIRDIQKIYSVIISTIDTGDNKDALLNFNGKFSFTGYDYTIPKDIPRFGHMIKLEISMEDYIRKAGRGRIDKKTDELKNLFMYDTHKQNSSFRSPAIGKSSDISRDDFDKLLFEMFRSGEREPHNRQIDASVLKNIITNLNNFSIVENNMRRNKSDMNHHYDEMLRLFGDLNMNQIKMEITDAYIDGIGDVTDFYTMYFKAMTTSMISLLRVIIEKMQAVREQLQDEKVIVFKALNLDV